MKARSLFAAVNSLLPHGAWDELGLAGLAISMFSMFLYLLTNIPVHHPTFSFRSYKSLPHTRSSTSKVCTLILILLCQWLANWNPFLRNFHHGLILPTSKQSIHCFFSRLMRKKCTLFIRELKQVVTSLVELALYTHVMLCLLDKLFTVTKFSLGLYFLLPS